MNGVARQSPATAIRRLPGLLFITGGLVLCALAGVIRAALVVPLHVPLDPNEGWNAYHAVAAFSSGSPYPPVQSLMTNNYPPLSFYLAGFLGSSLGDNVVAGRIVSLVAFALVLVLIVFTLRRLGVVTLSAVFAASLFAAILLLTSDYVGMDDPQLLGHALQLTGLILLLIRPRSSAFLIASAAFFVTGGFVKHNLFALPLAVLLWLAVADRRSAIAFFMALSGFSLAGICAVRVRLGVDLLHQLESARRFSVILLKENATDWFFIAAVPLCGTVCSLWRKGKEPAALLIALYAGISIITGLLLLAGAGVDVNAMFDADIAFVFGVGLAISQLAASDRPTLRAAGQIFAGLSVLPLVVIALLSPDWRDLSFWVHPLRDEAALASGDIAFLRAHSGPAMCENLTFCYWAGKKASVDVFNLNQQIETGVRDPKPLLSLIRARYFAVAEFDETSPFPFPKNVEHAFRGNYRLDHQNDEGAFFVRR